MIRVLTFDGDNPMHRTAFRFLFDAMRYGRRQDQAPPGIDVLRKERRIFRALEAVSEPDPEAVKTDPLTKVRHLTSTGGVVSLAQGDYETLKTYLETKVPWLSEAACDVADTADFLSAAPEANTDHV